MVDDPLRESATPLLVCAVPDCDARLCDRNTSGVCREHIHSSWCACGSCTTGAVSLAFSTGEDKVIRHRQWLRRRYKQRTYTMSAEEKRRALKEMQTLAPRLEELGILTKVTEHRWVLMFPNVYRLEVFPTTLTVVNNFDDHMKGLTQPETIRFRTALELVEYAENKVREIIAVQKGEADD